MPKNPIPPSIFKYEAFSAQSLLNLKSQVIYFGPSSGFNDPYDCALKASIADPTDDDVQRVFDRLAAKTQPTYSGLLAPEIKAQFVKVANLAFSVQRDKFVEGVGVTCLSEQNDDLLMWSHYGGSYRGFCLEFDTAYAPFNIIRKVKYVEEMPQATLEEVMIRDDDDLFLDFLCTKSVAWKYEKEWRAIHDVAGTPVGYEAGALKAIYFGPDIDPQAREILFLILDGQNEEVAYWVGSRSATEFKVQFESAGYTSFIEAKRKGSSSRDA